jgi:hypothetical protein
MQAGANHSATRVRAHPGVPTTPELQPRHGKVDLNTLISDAAASDDSRHDS